MSDVLERFMRYVQVDSQSDPNNEGQTPSTAIQFDMARVLAADLEELGLEDVRIGEHAYVTASLPASPGAEGLPALGFCAHMDSAPSAPASGVKPHIVHYEGGDLVVGVVGREPIFVSPDDEPDLKKFVGMDIVCSDGTTLLSGDDKAGVAEIMALLARLVKDPTLPHPCIKVAFVPDEEIGHGAELLDIVRFGAAWCYTVDGGVLGEVNYECFNACQATVEVAGVAIHPGDAKDRMINAITVSRQFDALIPEAERPEHTAGYEGYYFLNSLSGDATKMQMHYIIRDFFPSSFERRQQTLFEVAELLNKRYGEGTVKVAIRQQYRNMAERFKGCEFMIDRAFEANREVGIEPVAVPVRGGTDGAQLTFRGLPCPNLATGTYAMHSVREFVPVPSLEVTVDMLERLVAKFAVA